MSSSAILCADVGSTYTKVAAIDADSGALYASASHHTTIDSDVLDGLDAGRVQVEKALPPGVDISGLRVCSSAGGGLRLGVIGNEPLVTATAAHRAGLSAGAKVVAVAAASITDNDWEHLAACGIDVLLLAGGTDGGDQSVLLAHAQQLVARVHHDERLQVPVVFAGNGDVRDDVREKLLRAGLEVIAVDNVLPRIGQLNPQPARLALREAFLNHVIAGKQLSTKAAFADLVQAATPDSVLRGVELLADGFGETSGSGDLLVVDVGGATTDVYSVLTPDAELSGPRREVAGTAWRSRTVEGDLGLRHSASGIVSAAEAEGLLLAGIDDGLAEAAQWRTDKPTWLPDTDVAAAHDMRLTELAILLALRRHARGERLGGADTPLRGGKNLRAVKLIVGSGGVLRNRGREAESMLANAISADTAGGYPLPDRPNTVIDVSYVLGAAGLLSADHPKAALSLMRKHLLRL